MRCPALWLLVLSACGDKSAGDDDDGSDGSSLPFGDDGGSADPGEGDDGGDEGEGTGDDGGADSGDDDGSDGSDDTGDPDPPADTDGDGWAEDDDCDDADASVYPGATEICDGAVDHDCDGTVDQTCVDALSAAVVFEAEDVDDYLGWALSAGDLDGDGLDDLVLGAGRATGRAGGDDRGRLYVWSGPLSVGTLAVSDGDAEVEGRADEDYFAWQLAIVPDLDGDGIGDLVASSLAANSAWDGALDKASSGAVTLLSGPVTGALQMDDGIMLEAALGGENVGHYVVASAGDVTGDGVADLLVGAPGSDEGVLGGGAVYIFAGPITAELDATETTVTLTGNGNNDFRGSNYAGGDFNGDGIDDALFGAYYANETLWEDATEEAWLFHGPLSGALNGWDADAVVPGRGLYEHWSADVGAGDWDGDGWLDWAIGAPQQDSVGAEGAVHIILGPVSGTISSATVHSSILGTVDTFELGQKSGMIMGADLDVDGQDELILGARWHDTNGLTWNGVVAVFYGLTSGTMSIEDADLKVVGTDAGDQVGCELDVGDVDHDGLPDLIFGAYDAGTGGEAYVLSGWQL